MLMKARRIFLFFGVLLVAIGAKALAAESSWPGTEPSRNTVILVRILELSATGPDEKSHRLYSSPDGYVTTLDSLGRIGNQVQAKGLKEGPYHTLYVVLHDRYEVIRSNGERYRDSFSDHGKPTRFRIRGMIMVKKGQATPLRMFESHNDRQQHRQYYEEDD